MLGLLDVTCSSLLRVDRKRLSAWFFYFKKNGKLRIIVDTRLANKFFKPPDHSNLPTPSSFTSIEIDENDRIYSASGDVSDAFHHMSLPPHPHLRRFFRLMPIMCRHLPKELWPAGCSASDCVTPEYSTLPMGWDWSLYFCQAFLESCAEAAELLPADRIQDKVPVGKVEDRNLHAEYVGILSF